MEVLKIIFEEKYAERLLLFVTEKFRLLSICPSTGTFLVTSEVDD